MIKYENIINEKLEFPFEVFISDNLDEQIIVPEHFHNCFEMHFMLSGKANQVVNGAEFLSCEGDIVFIKSGDIHATYCEAAENAKIMVLKFMPSIINAEYSKLANSKYIASFLNFGNKKCFITLEKEKWGELKELLDEFIIEFSNKEKAYDLYIKGNIYKLIAFAVRNDVITIIDTHIKEFDVNRIVEILKHIENNYMQDIKLLEIAKKLNMNYSYASRYFKKITKKSFKEYLDYIRVCEADKLLIRNNDFIYNIASKCGFKSQQSFNRVYKRLRGFSPKIKNNKR